MIIRLLANLCLTPLLLLLLTSACSKSPLQVNELNLYSQTGIQCSEKDQLGSPTPIRSLSKRELTRSLRDIFGESLYGKIQTEISQIPNDVNTNKFDHISNKLTMAHIEALFSIAEAISIEVVNNHQGFFNVGTCFNSLNDQSCMGKFISDFALKLFRRPIAKEELATYLDLYSNHRSISKIEAAQLVIASMIQAPDFYYILEVNGSHKLGSSYLLTPYELATRLSFALRGTTPNEYLLNAAASGDLNTPIGIESVITKLLTTAEVRLHIEEFVIQYLGLNRLPALNYSNEFLNGLSTSGLQNQIANEAKDYMMYHILDNKSTFSDLMTSRNSFVKNKELASLYNISPSTVTTGAVLLPPERAGLLTRAALLISGEDSTKPFHRGNVLATNYLCKSIGRPDPKTVPDAFETIQNPHDISTRDYHEKLTSSNTCMACHSTLNSFGFALDNFDSLGRHRTTELKYDDNGKISYTFPIDAQVDTLIDGRIARTSSPESFTSTLANSIEAQQCFARKWFRFSFAKFENIRSDGCAIVKLSSKLNTPTAGILGMILETFKLQDFQHRIKPLE